MGSARQHGKVFLLLRGLVLSGARRDYCEPIGDYSQLTRAMWRRISQARGAPLTPGMPSQ